ncbi:DUF1801 domain-containing protein [Saccharothrix syringae]|uniref:DUF1801 domain-containing protein n=1 Tax=Saccharothrix syringae TaxID=103733 RepID=A0A5Q0GYT8_SACSY|nr:DUF1801 domain-containing protein [Saccharothrix syringae]QFZ19033.1 DUF1801 domain-containing protein [Saccharothrix syringae]
MTVTDYLAALDAPLRDIGEELRAVIDRALPGTTAAMWHGHPTWSAGDKPGRDPVCLVKAHRAHVTFGLWRGQDVDDPSGRLTPGARRMASVRLTGTGDVDAALFTAWLRQARDLDRG